MRDLTVRKNQLYGIRKLTVVKVNDDFLVFRGNPKLFWRSDLHLLQLRGVLHSLAHRPQCFRTFDFHHALILENYFGDMLLLDKHGLSDILLDLLAAIPIHYYVPVGYPQTECLGGAKA